jgi:hypothetical protein
MNASTLRNILVISLIGMFLYNAIDISNNHVNKLANMAQKIEYILNQ